MFKLYVEGVGMSTIRKCDACGKILESKDRYYTIDEISFNADEGSLTRVVFRNKETTNTVKKIESWCDYCDFDFCEDCFKKESGFR